MEPPSATPPSGPDEPGGDQPAEDARQEDAPAPWAPPDTGRPLFAPPEPQASWPAEHTYPVRPEEQPPAGPPPTRDAPGYLLPGQVAPGAGPFSVPPGYSPPGDPAQPGYAVPAGYPAQPGHPGYPTQPGYPYAGYAPHAYPVPGSPPYGYAVPSGPQVVPPPAGTPFHQQDRTEQHRWWRPLLGTAFLLGGAVVLFVMVFIGWMLGHALITGEVPEPEADGERIVGGTLEDIALQLTLLAVLTPLVLLTVRIFSRRPAGTVASVAGRIRWRWLGACVLAALAYVVVSLATSVAVTAAFTDDPLLGDWVGWSAFWLPALVFLLLVPFQATAEEFVFRGWLLQAIGGCTLRRPDGSYRNTLTRVLGRAFGTPWPAIVISSALFVSLHGYRTWAMVDIALWALACGWLAVRTGGLEAPVALHVLNNLLAFGAAAAAGELDDTLRQGAAPWYHLLSSVPPLVVFVLLVLWLSRRMGVAAATPEGMEKAPVPQGPAPGPGDRGGPQAGGFGFPAPKT